MKKEIKIEYDNISEKVFGTWESDFRSQIKNKIYSPLQSERERIIKKKTKILKAWIMTVSEIKKGKVSTKVEIMFDKKDEKFLKGKIFLADVIIEL